MRLAMLVTLAACGKPTACPPCATSTTVGANTGPAPAPAPAARPLAKDMVRVPAGEFLLGSPPGVGSSTSIRSAGSTSTSSTSIAPR